MLGGEGVPLVSVTCVRVAPVLVDLRAIRILITASILVWHVSSDGLSVFFAERDVSTAHVCSDSSLFQFDF